MAVRRIKDKSRICKMLIQARPASLDGREKAKMGVFQNIVL